jgi:uncharacterized hydrophobic protein (TIGR00271 family)
MLELRIHAHVDATPTILRSLEGLPGVANIVAIPQQDRTVTLMIAEVQPQEADAVLVGLKELGLTHDEVRLIRHRTIPWLADSATGPDDGFIWSHVVAEARATSRAAPRYLVLMAVAGVLAALSVIQANEVLLVGAMAISPDLLPIVGTCVGLVGRRPRMFGRSLGSLALGLAVCVLGAFTVTAFLLAIGRIDDVPKDLPGFIASLLTLDVMTVIVAFAAGIAAMLAFETRAGAAVGVAISVTTIPAAAFLGVALAAQGLPGASRALSVLAVNIVFLVVGGALTLLIQRIDLRRRAAGPSLQRVA